MAVPRLDSRSSRRWPRLLGIALALAVAVGTVVLTRYRNTTTPVTVAEAVEDFRADPGAPPPTTPSTDPVATPERSTTAVEAPSPRPVLPTAGVYVYTTSGRERIDALGGAGHDYPATTTLTVRDGGCGAIVRWQPLEERHEEWEMCDQGDVAVIVAYTSLHRFFGTDDRQVFVCDAPIELQTAVHLPSPAPVTCRSDTLVERVVTVPIPPAPIVVDGKEVPSRGVSFAIELSGSAEGRTSGEMWFAESTGALVAWSETVETVSGSAIGDVRYTERFSLTLDSLEPTR